MIREHDDVLPPFLGRARGRTLNVIGRYEHFLRSVVPPMMDIVGVDYCPLPDGPVPVGSQQAYIFWHNRHPAIPPAQAVVDALAGAGRRIVNFSSFSNLKSQVQRSFARVFGYELAVDPLVYVGAGVIKGDNENGSHTARFVRFPISEMSPESVYERQVRNEVLRTNGEVWTQDYRVPVFDGRIPFVVTKVYPVQQRSDRCARASLVVSAFEALTESEMKRIASFCEDLGISYCELDVLRDLHEDRIYIVDANTTPYWGWRNLMKPGETEVILRIMATEALRNWWL